MGWWAWLKRLFGGERAGSGSTLRGGGSDSTRPRGSPASRLSAPGTSASAKPNRGQDREPGRGSSAAISESGTPGRLPHVPVPPRSRPPAMDDLRSLPRREDAIVAPPPAAVELSSALDLPLPDSMTAPPGRGDERRVEAPPPPAPTPPWRSDRVIAGVVGDRDAEDPMAAVEAVGFSALLADLDDANPLDANAVVGGGSIMIVNDELSIDALNWSAERIEPNRQRPVIVADVDGTLWGDPRHGRQYWPGFVKFMRQHIEARGVIFCVNTGMTYERFDQNFTAQREPLWPTHALLSESEIYHLVEPGIYREHADFNDVSRRTRRQAIASVTEDIKRWARDWQAEANIVRWQVQRYDIMFQTKDAENAKRLERAIRQTFAENGVAHLKIIRNMRMIALHSTQYSKANLLRQMIVNENWDRSQILTLGDDVNDLSMLHSSLGNAACVANAVPEVKRLVSDQGGFISQKPYGEGAMECISWFLNRQGIGESVESTDLTYIPSA